MYTNINWDEMNDIEGYVVATFTDEYLVGVWKDKIDYIKDKQDNLLELRVFNEDKEIKYCRGNIGTDRGFHERIRDDANNINIDYYDELQYLDIDERRSEILFKDAHIVYPTTSVKPYYMPLDNMKNAGVIIRHYISKDEESGQAYISDWRVVKFDDHLEKECDVNGTKI